MTAQFLTGCAMLTGDGWLHGHGVLLRDGHVEAVLPAASAPAAERVQLPPEALLAPGLVDVQVNGGGGILFNDRPTRAAALAIAAAHRRLGTTSLMPTLITDTEAAMRSAASAIEGEPACSPLLGIHFEGPFLGPGRPGVHRPELIRAPAEAELVLLEDLARSTPHRVLLTIAPETVDDPTIRRLAATGIILSAGHTDAGFERTGEALEAGVTGFTHLFNAMPPLAAREPGVAAAALLAPGAFCGVIADGIHVHPAMLRLLLANRAAAGPGSASGIMLVSDAMPPTGTDATEFTLQGRRIVRRNGRLTTESGTLAGADICLMDAVRFAVRELSLTTGQALGMATAIPAAFLRLERRVGHIAPGCQADLLLLSPALDVLGTWAQGQWEGHSSVLATRAAA